MKYVLYPINEYSIELPLYFSSYVEAVVYGIRAYGEKNFLVERQELQEA